jgi:hypothetical protein
MSNKIRITGLRNVEILDSDPEEGKEYAITIRAEVEKIEKDIKDPKNPYYIYKMPYLATLLINEVGGKEIKVQEDISKYSDSQIQKFAINDSLLKFVQDKEEMDKFYKILMSKNIKIYNTIKELGLNPMEIMDKFLSWVEAKKI